MPADHARFLISVVVTTYNRPDALRCVLDSLLDQTDPAFEIIVADDGSGAPTARMLAPYLSGERQRVRHVWHQDDGFRAGAIRNRAVEAANGDYVVYLDGDCMVRPNFIAEHRRIARPGCLVTGSRILMSAALTRRILDAALPAHQWPWSTWARLRLSGDINRLITLLPLPGDNWRRYRRFDPRRTRSCNLAAWRTDIDTINGFDEAFVGWGHEDLDFVGRMDNAGVVRLRGAGAATVLHLWHPEAARTADTSNLHRAQSRKASGVIRAERGLAEGGGG